MENETRTLDFVEESDFFLFININKKACFQIGKDNKYYGVDFNLIETELTFEREKAIFTKKQFNDLKNGDVWFPDLDKIHFNDIYLMINTDTDTYIYFSETYNCLQKAPYYNYTNAYVWVAKKKELQ